MSTESPAAVPVPGALAELAAARARIKALGTLSNEATEGPWLHHFAAEVPQDEVWSVGEQALIAVVGADVDAAFIVAAINYVRAVAPNGPALTTTDADVHDLAKTADEFLAVIGHLSAAVERCTAERDAAVAELAALRA